MIIEPTHYQKFISQAPAYVGTATSFKVFPDIDIILKTDPQLFVNLDQQTKSKTSSFRQMQFLTDDNFNDLALMIDSTPLGKNATPMLIVLYQYMTQSRCLDFGDVSEVGALAICQFASTLGELLHNKDIINAQKNKDYITASNLLKASIFSRPLKEFYILQQWLMDWAKYLLRENQFNPLSLPHYKQGDLIRVDFGWRIGREFGGIHYAIVAEKNNNPRNSMIFLVPISSYDFGEKIHHNDVDLGTCINNKLSFAVLTQTGAYSKMRILNNRIYGRLPSSTMNKILSKIALRFGIKK